MIRLENVTKQYGSTVALDNLSLEVYQGEVCVLVGPSGCGKSTCLKMINRMLEPTYGAVYVKGKNVKDFEPEILRRQIGYVIQSVGLFPHMTVAENVGLVPGLLKWDRKKIADRVEELLGLVGLDPKKYLAKYPKQLSGGEAQRIGVARALAADPEILLMDEPFGALDPLNRNKLQTEFLRIQKELKKTVVLVTHFIDEAIRLGDRIVMMKSGKLVQYDTPENILISPLNSFVRNFVGTDRTFKLLQRYSVKSLMRPAVTASVTDGLEGIQPRLHKDEIIWVTDQNSRLVGWTDAGRVLTVTRVRDAVVKDDLADLAVQLEATLEEALSKMLGLRLKKIAITDNDKRMLGEVWLTDIERVAYQGDMPWK